MWRLLLVDDQAIVRQGLQVMLEQDEKIRVTHEAENGAEAIAVLEKYIIDVIIMDIRMPVMNGIEATRIIKRRWPNVHILMLTTFNDEDYAMDSLRDGADGFLLKTADSEQLIKAVYSCMRGGMIIHDDVAAKVMPRLLHNNEQTAEMNVQFSNRELAITKLIGAGKTNQEIANELFLSVGTVKNYLSEILTKTDLRDRTQLAIFAVKNGLVD